jgi:MFS family permease
MSDAVKFSRRPPGSRRSRVGLNITNFFLAEITGVVLPFLAKFLTERGWPDGMIGLAAALAGLGVFLMQTPAGYLVDRLRGRRGLLAAASLGVGLSYGLLPLVPARLWSTGPLLFGAGVCQSFFGPLVGALALGLVGHAALSRTFGANQSWNHAGNIAAAGTAMLIVGRWGITAVFYAVFAVSLLAAAAVFLIRPGCPDAATRGRGDTGTQGFPASPCRRVAAPPSVPFRALFHDRRVLVLFAAVALFHLANAPVMPLVGMDVARLGGSDRQVAAVVLVAQAVMVPVAWAAGRLCETWGRKPVFAVGFLVLPLRIVLYSLADRPGMLVALQALDGIGAGIYGVAIVNVCADLTRGKGGFNTLQGVMATAQSAGGVCGPLAAGFLVQYLGFPAAFDTFAGVAVAGAVLFVGLMPETRTADEHGGGVKWRAGGANPPVRVPSVTV